jgi:hypothetical protein
MQTVFVTVDRVFSKVIRDFGLKGINEIEVIEWIGEAMQKMNIRSSYEEAVSFIEVSSYQCEMPLGLQAVIQIARNNCFSSVERLCPSQVIESISSTTEQAPQDPVPIDCQGTPLEAFDLAYYRPYYDLTYEYSMWMQSSIYSSCFSPVRLKTNSFFNSIVCTEQNSESLYKTSSDEYTIVNGNILRFSFESGQIALAYLRQITDKETGYPMVPDFAPYIEALAQYVIYKISSRNFYRNREGSLAQLQYAEKEWAFYCGQAKNRMMFGGGVDQFQNILDQRNYMLPRYNRYSNYFGNLGKPETRRFNDPNQRNTISYLRGYGA